MLRRLGEGTEPRAAQQGQHTEPTEEEEEKQEQKEENCSGRTRRMTVDYFIPCHTSMCVLLHRPTDGSGLQLGSAMGRKMTRTVSRIITNDGAGFCNQTDCGERGQRRVPKLRARVGDRHADVRTAVALVIQQQAEQEGRRSEAPMEDDLRRAKKVGSEGEEEGAAG